MPGTSLREKLDALQQRHVVLAFSYAVHKRFTEDLGRHFAALMDVPRVNRPNFLVERLRALAMLGVVGAGTVAGSAVAGIATQLDDLAVVARVATTLGTAAINSASLLVGYRLLTVASQQWRVLLPGSIWAASRSSWCRCSARGT
ncbi:MAG TPA: hypothetical protein VM282_10275 [Acidimicrobiales bacterium]|nr:hypothetical protein [Acidimicrobiales bacterium]